jgi:hypothetical protein
MSAEPLDGGAERDALVGVHPLARLALEELGDRLLDLRHARHAADEDDLLDLVLLEPRVGASAGRCRPCAR